MPLTANGKLDRKALPAPDGAAHAARGYEAPAGEIEMHLARIWAEALGLERVGRHDNFFELGGHSLAALRLVAQIASTFDVEVGVAALFMAPTIGEFAARVSKAETPLEPWTIVQIQPRGEKTRIIAINDTMRYYSLSAAFRCISRCEGGSEERKNRVGSKCWGVALRVGIQGECTGW